MKTVENETKECMTIYEATDKNYFKERKFLLVSTFKCVEITQMNQI